MAKRAKQAKESEDETPEEERIGELAEWAGIYEPDPLVAAQIIWRYAAKVLTPRALAEERRKAGDPTASPRDYDCGCPISIADKLPRCFGDRECRFKHRYEAPPRLANDPVRHQMEKTQYAQLKASLRTLPESEALERVGRILDWYDREVLAKKGGAHRLVVQRRNG